METESFTGVCDSCKKPSDNCSYVWRKWAVEYFTEIQWELSSPTARHRNIHRMAARLCHTCQFEPEVENSDLSPDDSDSDSDSDSGGSDSESDSDSDSSDSSSDSDSNDDSDSTSESETDENPESNRREQEQDNDEEYLVLEMRNNPWLVEDGDADGSSDDD